MIWLVLGLSLVPCCETVGQVMDETAIQNLEDCCRTKTCEGGKNESQDADSEKNTCAACSPFFACGSCAGFVFQNIHFNFSNLHVVSQTDYCAYDVQFDSEYFNTMWQPPKIS